MNEYVLDPELESAAIERHIAALERAAKRNVNGRPREPKVLSLEQIMERDLPPPEFLFEGLITWPGMWLCVGPSKVGKTTLAIQMALSFQAGEPLFENYRTNSSGKVLLILQDDPYGLESLRRAVQRTPVRIRPGAVEAVESPQFTIGPELVEFLTRRIERAGSRFIVLDSFSAMRPAVGGSADRVKAEWMMMRQLDELAKASKVMILMTHHRSFGRRQADWFEQAAGTYAVSAAVEGIIHIDRFEELEPDSLERIVRVRSRRSGDAYMVVRLRPETMSFELVAETIAADQYPQALELKNEFGSSPFTPREVVTRLGWHRRTVFRTLNRLKAGRLVRRTGYGHYQVEL